MEQCTGTLSTFAFKVEFPSILGLSWDPLARALLRY